MPHLDAQPQDSSTKLSRKGKERDATHRELPQREPQPTDLVERFTAMQRRSAATFRSKERSERERPQVSQQLPHSQSQLPPIRSERSPKPVPASTSTSRQSPPSQRRHANPQVTISRVGVEADPDEFSRRLQITSSPTPRRTQATGKSASSKLFNPDTDPIPLRRTAEPEAMSDSADGSHVPRTGTVHQHQHQRDDRGSTHARQLFDYRKDDPVRFSVLARPQNGRSIPTPKSSADYVSASSTSSYAASISSSTFTLSSTTDGSSASSALFENGKEREESGNNKFSGQLKSLYRTITSLEAHIKQGDSHEEMDDGIGNRLMLKGKEVDSQELEKEKWKKQIADHKRLAETIHSLLDISLAPSVPASLRNIPTKYNIIVRLWTFAFHRLLESLRRASFSSPIAAEHLQDFIYYAYTFYTGLLEDPFFTSFKSGWLEALGDLARYRMHMAAMVNSTITGQGSLTAQAVSEAAAVEAALANDNEESGLQPPKANVAKSASNAPAARIDDSPSPSVGIAAARMMDVQPEKERWRCLARDWYGSGLAEQPGTGKLHHHLGLLTKEVEGEELRGVYHFVKSMTTLHPFTTSRESVLPIWSPTAQAKRSLPDAHATDLFVLLHGMLFTNIQLDDFQPTLARFLERLRLEGAEEREWIMMGVINIAAVLEYGRPTSVLRKVGAVGPRDAGVQQAAAMRVIAKKVAAGVPTSSVPSGEDKMDVDDEHHQHTQANGGDQIMKSPMISTAQMSSPALSEAEPAALEHPVPFRNALQLTFAMLSMVLRNPTRKASQFDRSTLNPYLTVLLTFLATLLKHPQALTELERAVPWEELAAFFATVPRKVMDSQGLLGGKGSQRGNDGERWVMLTSSCAPPLAEDWCLRGMEWVGRKIFERGYWKSGEERRAEIEVLEEGEGGEMTDGRIEDDDGEEDSEKPGHSLKSDLVRRWIRIVRCGVGIAGAVDGFTWADGTREWSVEGKLAEKVARWREEDRFEREEEERRRMGRRWVDEPMDVDMDDAASSEEDSEDDEDDSEEVKALKARRRYLKNLLHSQSIHSSSLKTTSSRRTRTGRRDQTQQPLLKIVPGFTILVIDTNLLLSFLPMVVSFIESLHWTVVVPLPVIMELDGLSSSSSSQLAEAAQSAVNYITSHIRSHSQSLKVQTSKGNYLTSLNVRTEEIDFSSSGSGDRDRNMDDLILKAAIWQDDHWVDRSAMLKAREGAERDLSGAIKVVLLSLDRNLRLKARSRQLPAANEKDLTAILAAGT